jgi:hypothetical protein
MPTDPAARAAACAFLARYAAPSEDPVYAAGALYRAYTIVSTNLRSAVGDDGTDALLGRAMARAVEQHPTVGELRRTATANIDAAQLAAAVATHGEPAVRAAIEDLLGTVIELLTRLVGEGLAMRLIDHDGGVVARPFTDERVP